MEVSFQGWMQSMFRNGKVCLSVLYCSVSADKIWFMFQCCRCEIATREQTLLLLNRVGIIVCQDEVGWDIIICVCYSEFNCRGIDVVH